MARKGSIYSRLHSERGISTVIVVVSLIGVFGAALLSVDFGSMWSTRRRLVTGTDATALDQARLAANTGSACNTNPGLGTVYTDFLISNAGAIVTGSNTCVLHPNASAPGTGYVQVDARKFADTRFGGLSGWIGDTQPYSLSAAQYGYITQPKGLRPMAYCVDNDHVQQWVALKNGTISQAQYNALAGTGDAGGPDGADADPFMDPPADGNIDYPSSYTGAGVVHRMYFTKDNPNDCGANAPGNWGWMDFNGGSNSTSDLSDWVQNGYDGVVGVGDCDPNAAPTPEPCPGDTGSAGGSPAQELDYLISNNAVFAIPVFSAVSGTGSNAQFTIWGFLVVQLRGYRITGSSSNRYFDFEFVDDITSGVCCSNTATNPGGPKGVKICGVDHDGTTTDAVIAARCGQTT